MKPFPCLLPICKPGKADDMDACPAIGKGRANKINGHTSKQPIKNGKNNEKKKQNLNKKKNPNFI